MKQLWLWFAYLPPATKLGQGNVLAGVCDSVNGGVPGRGGLLPGGCTVRGLGCLGWPLLRAVRILLECILVLNLKTSS